MATRKRQHFIPRLHLQHFVGTEPKGHVWTYDAQTGDVRSAIPEQTAIETHFYSAQKADGTMDTRLEEHLATVESNAAPIYKALLLGKLPKDDQERAYFSTFLALMYARTPAMRRMFAEIVSRSTQIMAYAYGSNEKAFDALMKRMERDGEPVLSPDQKEKVRKDMLDPSGYVLEVPKDRTLPALGVADRLALILFRMKWTIVLPRHGFFITSDNPLVREVDPKTHHPIYGDHGFLNKTAQVVFPLSPQRLLLMSWKGATRDIGVIDSAYVNGINRGLAAQSDRYLYAHIRHKRIKELAAEFKNSRPAMTTRGFGPTKFVQSRVVRRPK